MMLNNNPSAEATQLTQNSNPANNTSAGVLPRTRSPGQKGKSAQQQIAGGKLQRSSAAKPSVSAPSKQDRVLAMLRRKDGASIAAIMKATGWQQHSARGFFAAVVRKKLRLNFTSEETGGKRIYRIAASNPSARKRSR